MKRTVTLALALVIAACSRTGAPRGNSGSVVIVQQREPQSLNTALENGQSATEWSELLFSYLVKFNDKGQLIGDVAKDVPTPSNHGISTDGKTIVYHLRHAVRFADGTRLTARDCVYSIQAIQNPANNVQTRYGYDRITKAEAPDDYTLVLHLREPFAPLLTLVLAPQGFPILPAHLLAREPDFNHLPFNEKPLGSGPYVVQRWVHGDRVEMSANPYYFAGLPKIKHLTVRFVPDANTAINLLHTGEADFLYNDQDYSNVPLLQTLPNIVVMKEPLNSVGAIIFNTQNPLTNDARARHALAMAIDVPSLVRKAYRGVLDSKNAGRGLFEWAYDPNAYPDVRYDPAESRRLLDAAGWKMQRDGLRHKGGQALDLLFIIQAGTPGDQTIGAAVRQYENAVGADITLKAFNVTQFVAPASAGGPVYGGNFSMALYPFVNGDDPDVTDQFSCSHIPPNGYNKSRICDPRLDKLMIAARSTYDVARRKALYVQIQRILAQDMPLILIYQRRELNAFNSRLGGVTGSVSSVFWNVAGWYTKT